MHHCGTAHTYLDSEGLAFALMHTQIQCSCRIAVQPLPALLLQQCPNPHMAFDTHHGTMLICTGSQLEAKAPKTFWRSDQPVTRSDQPSNSLLRYYCSQLQYKRPYPSHFASSALSCTCKQTAMSQRSLQNICMAHTDRSPERPSVTKAICCSAAVQRLLTACRYL